MKLSKLALTFCLIGLACKSACGSVKITANSSSSATVVNGVPTATANSSSSVVTDAPAGVPRASAAPVGGVPPAVAHGHAVVAPGPSIVWKNLTNSKDSRRTRLAIGVLAVGLTVGGAGALIFGIGFIWFILRIKRRKGSKVEEGIIYNGEIENGMGPRKFSFAQIAKMTRNFKGEKLGEGGFGDVYKGYLWDLDAHVAVKRISKASKQGLKEYASEVKIINRLRHKNLVKLIGWCHEKDELILVYEFMANGSLYSHLFKGQSLLGWDVRFKIVQGLASALCYLHEEGDHCVLHRDIKTSNVMLDSGFNAKLGDFGLARLVCHAKGWQTTDLAGTMGYIAPECVSSGKASKEADVYGFGVVALEIACGRRSVEPEYEESQVSLVEWVWDSYGNGRLLGAADPKLGMHFDVKRMECLLIVGLWCVHPDQNLRPSIRQAIQVLDFEAPLPNLPSTMPILMYGAPIGCEIQASGPCFSTDPITIPR